jgi:hypothetical protein
LYDLDATHVLLGKAVYKFKIEGKKSEVVLITRKMF